MIKFAITESSLTITYFKCKNQIPPPSSKSELESSMIMWDEWVKGPHESCDSLIEEIGHTITDRNILLDIFDLLESKD